MKAPAVLEHLPWRIGGVVLLGVLVVVYQPESMNVVHRLVIPVAMALATWLMVQNAVAVAIGAGALAAIHSDLGSRDWILSVAYPVLTAVSVVVVTAIWVKRFRRRIAETHEQRWRHRRNDSGQQQDRGS